MALRDRLIVRTTRINIGDTMDSRTRDVGQKLRSYYATVYADRQTSQNAIYYADCRARATERSAFNDRALPVDSFCCSLGTDLTIRASVWIKSQHYTACVNSRLYIFTSSRQGCEVLRCACLYVCSFVCLSVCLSARVSQKVQTSISVHITRDRGSVVF